MYIILSIILIIVILFGASFYTVRKRHNLEKVVTDNLDHDIKLYNLKKIIDTTYTGIQPWVGPSPASWPIGVPQKWEVALFEDDTHYYARLIYHEYMLWWSWDEPYIVVKLNKSKVPDLHDESNRGKVLWDITYNRLHGYDTYHYGLDAAIIEHINGHSVLLSPYYNCSYYKYDVICNADDRW
jgi:hypothetical protein